MIERSIVVWAIRFLALTPIVASGCAGELSEDAKGSAGSDGVGGSGGSNAGGAGGSGGSGAAGGTGGAGGMGGAGGAGGSGVNPEVCVLAVMKAKSCAVIGCHAGSLPAAQLLLTDEAIGKAKEQFLDKQNKGMSGACTAGTGKLIDKAQPDKSLLYTKLLPQPTCGTRMPTGSPELNTQEMACMLEWIKAVAAAP